MLIGAVPKRLESAVWSRLVVLASAGALGCTMAGVSGPDQQHLEPESGELLVLFIGSSYFESNDMPGIFEQLSDNAGIPVYVTRNVLSGNYLDFFAENEWTANAIEEQKWDYVVLQGGCQNAAYPEDHHLITPNSGYHPVFPALQQLKRKINANHSATKVVYMMPWAFEDGMTWVSGMTDTYMDMQEKIRDNVLAWSDSLDIIVAPVGWAWRDVLEDNQEQHYLHSADWNHPNWRGSYLSAAVITATVFTESVTELTYYGLLGEAEAHRLLDIASRTVLDSLDLWNLGNGSSSQF